MSEVEQQPASPEVVEPEPIVVDADLAARCFWAGVKAADRKLSGDELLGVFVATIAHTYPATEKHEQVRRMGAHFERAMKELEYGRSI
jgi:hypothetical protein